MRDVLRHTVGGSSCAGIGEPRMERELREICLIESLHVRYMSSPERKRRAQ